MKLFKKTKFLIQKYFWDFFWENFQLPEVSCEELGFVCEKFVPRKMEKICLPPYAGNETFDDYSILISYLKTKKPSKILELGTAHGNTTANMCIECDAKIYTVNALPDQISGKIITYNLSKEEIGQVYRDGGFGSRVVQIYENTKNIEILNYIERNSIDLAFIDACHDAEFVVNDFLKILPSLSESACVIFHDTHPSGEKHLLDSYLGCMFLRKKQYNIVHIMGSSLGFWSKKSPKISNTFWKQTSNYINGFFAMILFGKEENYIMRIRWLASGFLKGKFKYYGS